MQGLKLSFWFSYFNVEGYCLIILPQASTGHINSLDNCDWKKENMNKQVSYVLSKGIQWRHCFNYLDRQ